MSNRGEQHRGLAETLNSLRPSNLAVNLGGKAVRSLPYLSVPAVFITGGLLSGAVGGHEPRAEVSQTVEIEGEQISETEILTFSERDDLRFASATAEQNYTAEDINYSLHIDTGIPNLLTFRDKDDTVSETWSYAHNKQVTGPVNINFFMPNDAMQGTLTDGQAEVSIDASQFIVEAAWDRESYKVNTYVGDDPESTDHASTSEDVLKLVAGFNAIIKLEEVESLIMRTEEGVDRRLQAAGLNTLESSCMGDVSEYAQNIVEDHARTTVADKYSINPQDVNVSFDNNWTWNTPLQDDPLEFEDSATKFGVFYQTSVNYPEVNPSQIICSINSDVLEDGGSQQ